MANSEMKTATNGVWKVIAAVAVIGAMLAMWISTVDRRVASNTTTIAIQASALERIDERTRLMQADISEIKRAIAAKVGSGSEKRNE